MKDRKVMISIVSVQSDGESSSRIELDSEGVFRKLDDGFEVSYDETEATGFAGSHTRLTYKNDGYITMDRSGSTSSKLILEQGKRHLCRYGTPYGEMSVGVSTSMVNACIDEVGAKMQFHYAIDINSQELGNYEITLNASFDA